ncbi:hypothetical protein ACIQF5_33760, partial [Streptomyces goshikiensis]|uniref:hypothetical protein n=1 Tax=Streptomyces goshikiensis TaxID=1942 RepID=UPI0038151C0A
MTGPRGDGREHTVVAPHCTSVRLIGDGHAASEVLPGHLPSSDGFAVVYVGHVRQVMGDQGAWKGPPKKVECRAAP